MQTLHVRKTDLRSYILVSTRPKLIAHAVHALALNDVDLEEATTDVLYALVNSMDIH